MKVLITGANGLLGQEVWKVFEKEHDLCAAGRTRPPFVPDSQWREVDWRQADLAYRILTRENPDCVVHCAAYNQVDQAEASPEEALRGNGFATRNIALACQRFDTVLLAVSTDYVFDGHQAPPEGYREWDPPHPISRYGESKRLAEIYVEQLLNKFYIVRTSWLFGPSRMTYVDQVAQWARDNKPIPAVVDMVSAPTYTPDLAEALRVLVESGHYGIYHLTNSGFCNRVELARAVLDLHGGHGKSLIQPLRQDSLKLPARRPVFSGLDNAVWRLEGRSPLRPWREALQAHFTREKVELR